MKAIDTKKILDHIDNISVENEDKYDDLVKYINRYSNIYICDRCKKSYYTNEEESHRIKILDYNNEKYDICKDCYYDLFDWFYMSGKYNENKQTEATE